MIEVNDQNYQSEVLDSELPCLVDFWAPWCGPCFMVAPTVEKIANDYKGKIKVVKINVDQAPDTASKNGIMSIPTLAIFKNGKAVDTIIGALPENAIVAKVKQHI